jgi:hypothetical protein
MGQGIANDLEPASASVGVHPTFDERAFRIFPVEQVVRPLRVAGQLGSGWALPARFAPATEFGLVPKPAKWTFY